MISEMEKKMILRELQDLKDSLIYQQDIDKSEIDR